MKQTATCWYKVTSQLRFDPSKSPLIPLLHNPDFPPGMSINTRKKLITANSINLIKANSINLKSMFKKSYGTLLSYGDIKETANASEIPHYLYLQMRHYALSIYPKACLPPNHPLIELCKQSSTQRGMITAWYKTINDPIQHPHKKTSICATIKENLYKVIMVMYHTPKLLHKLFPDTAASVCCEEQEGSLLHIFWSCQKLKRFWEMVRGLVERVTMLTLGLNPLIFVLANKIPNLKNPAQKMVNSILTAARALKHDNVDLFGKVWGNWDAIEAIEHVRNAWRTSGLM
ncbi:hypothetical protein XELAEV_18027740mg [Xenopus laevis]|uniref:Uncharacterized protein n=1 Tax=Xenopus laevis TaxID=8355 RepID=A0A974HK96_XENLA|nr:hypothetical protein XELAEV_18027740mg [Xenopus laevis]